MTLSRWGGQRHNLIMQIVVKNPVKVVAAVFYKRASSSKKNEDQVLIFRRAMQTSHSGQWEFPGGKLESGENEEEALQREIWEELGVRIKVEARIGERTHHYPFKTIQLIVYMVSEIGAQEFQLLDHDDLQWLTQNELLNFSNLAPADSPFIKQIFDYLKSSVLF